MRRSVAWFNRLALEMADFFSSGVIRTAQFKLEICVP